MNTNEQETDEIDWEREEWFLEMERGWKRDLERTKLSIRDQLTVYSDIIPDLPTILAECEESKRDLEMQILDKLAETKSQENQEKHWLNMLSLAIGLGAEVVKKERHILYLKSLIALSSPHNNRYAFKWGNREQRRLLALETPIESLLTQTKVHNRGNRKVCLCPLHNEKTPSFTIYPNNKWWCYGCSEGGDAISLAMRMHNFTFPEAINYLTN